VPDKPTYLHRLKTILKEAKSPKPIPFFRRCDIEALFGLKRRQAINLMHKIGAVRVSREIAVPQPDLVSWIEKIALDPAGAREISRQERVIGRIVDLKAETAARAIKIVLPDGAPPADFPEGVSLQPGLLTVSFDDEQQLLERLFLLARVFAARPQLLNTLSVAVRND
jgi:hypothetical protein